MKSLIIILSSVFIFAQLGISQQLALPNSSHAAGIYTSDISVELSHSEPGVTIYYTLDGNEPDQTDLVYSAPLLMSNISGAPNNYSMVPTNPSFTYPVGLYTEIRANNRGWLPPVGDVEKINVLRFRAYKTGFEPSEIVTKTFMIDPLGPNKFSFPVLSIVYDSDDLFSNDSGIYVYGDHPNGNYSQTGVEWERLSHFEYFDMNGNVVISENLRSRLHGGGSRSSCTKNIRVYADTDDHKNFDYPFFENYELEKFKRIIIRSGGHRPDCFPRDNIASMLTDGLQLDQQHYKHIILFINGEFWGIHTIKERIDQFYIQNRYNIDDSLITILNQSYSLQEGDQADSDEMIAIADFASTNDMSIASNYNSVADKIDIDNYIDYMATEIFLSNEDWVISNVLIWKKNGPYDASKPAGHDGKYRWILFDLDGAFGGVCSNAYYTVNTLEAATVTIGPNVPFTRLFNGLLGNPDFKNKFVNRLCDLMNSHYRANRMNEKITEIYNELTPEMMRNVERWRYPSIATTLVDRAMETPNLTKWDFIFEDLHIFANRRQRKVREHMMIKWAYPDSSLVTVNVNDPAMGMVKVNSLVINHDLPGVNANPYPWTGYYMNTVELPLVAIPLPGYRFVEWLETGETNDTTIWNPISDSLYTAVFEAEPSYQPIRINELMASNNDYMYDNFEDDDDWVELFNPNTFSVNLSGCILQRGTSSWVIPSGTIINPNNYLIFWNDSQTYQGANHTNFNLPNSPNTIYLKTPNNAFMDSLYYPSTTTNYSFGRYPNGSNSYSVFSYPTPLASNNISNLDELSEPKLMAYPNPTTGNLYLSKAIDFTLYDLQGKQVKSGTNQTLINTSDLQAGIYILISSDQEILKISVQK